MCVFPYLCVKVEGVLHLEGALEAALAGPLGHQVLPHLINTPQLDPTGTEQKHIKYVLVECVIEHNFIVFSALVATNTVYILGISRKRYLQLPVHS